MTSFAVGDPSPRGIVHYINVLSLRRKIPGSCHLGIENGQTYQPVHEDCPISVLPKDSGISVDVGGGAMGAMDGCEAMGWGRWAAGFIVTAPQWLR